MSQEQYTTSEGKYKQVTIVERGKIEALRKAGYTQGEIARMLGKSQSTISREIARNSVDQLDTQLRPVRRYYAEAAQRQAMERRAGGGNQSKHEQYPEVMARIEGDILEKGWTPDAAIGRLERESGERCPFTVRTFYNYVDKGLTKVKPIDLPAKVSRKPRKKKSQAVGKAREIGRSIEERPATVETREEFGHWEIDGVVGKATDRQELMTLVERKTRMGLVMRLESRTQEGVAQAMRKLAREYKEQFTAIFKTITSDNGSEFLGWRRMEAAGYKRRKAKTRVYYAHPYRASERGSNENYNGLLRRKIPKGKSIDGMALERIDLAMRWVNDLPRRSLGYQTAAEAFSAELAALG